MPSAKNALSLSSERLRNGRTAMLFGGMFAGAAFCRDGSIVPPGEQREGGSDDPDQTSRNSQSARRFPTVENLCAAILQLQRECTDTRPRGWFGGKHRHEQRNETAWNTCRLQLFDRQSSRALARANLFDGSRLGKAFCR